MVAAAAALSRTERFMRLATEDRASNRVANNRSQNTYSRRAVHTPHSQQKKTVHKHEKQEEKKKRKRTRKTGHLKAEKKTQAVKEVPVPRSLTETSVTYRLDFIFSPYIIHAFLLAAPYSPAEGCNLEPNENRIRTR